MTNITYRTPEAAGFLYQGKDLISEYTGNPGISIPLLELTEKDITIPVELTYDGKAIDVSQEASWVGLGWSLNIGGCINYVPAGKNDCARTVYYDWQKFNNLFANRLDGDIILGFDGHEKFENLALQQNDAEPDFYQVSVLGKSFSFFRHPSSTTNRPHFEIIGEYDEKYEIYENAPNWIIKDGNGYTYYFNQSERNGEPMYDGFLNHAYCSSWRLTRIISPQRAEVNFSYSRNVVQYQPHRSLSDHYIDSVLYIDGWYPWPDPDFLTPIYSDVEVSLQNTISEELLLDSIYSDAWCLRFQKGSRTDVKGWQNSTAQKLDSLKLYSTLDAKEKKRISFEYGYFNASDGFISSRLKLTSVTDGISNDPAIYSFEYDEAHNLPSKNCVFSDPWGYYNGITQRKRYHKFEFKDEKMDRVSPAHLTTGMLTKIHYPTGGYTEYQYEPNTFSSKECPLYTKKDSIYKYISSTNSPYETSNCTFHMRYGSEGVLHYKFFNLQTIPYSNYDSVQIVLHNVLEANHNTICIRLSDCLGTNNNSSSIEGSIVFPLSSGTYVFSASKGSSTNIAITADITLKSFDKTDYSVGGGVRTQKVLNYDENGQLCNSIQYEYKNEGGSTSGLLLYPFKQDKYEVYEPYGYDSNGRFLSEIVRLFRHDILCKNVTAASNAWLGGRDVGYSRVIRTEKDRYNRVLSKTISTYSNSVSYKHFNAYMTYYSNISNIEYLNAGRLLTLSVLDRNDKLLQKNSYIYSRKAADSNIVAAQYHNYNILVDSNRYIPEIYCYASVYAYHNAWTVLQSIIAQKYDAHDPDIVNREEINYDYYSHNLMVKTIKKRDNSGDYIIDSLTYNYPNIPNLVTSQMERYCVQGTAAEKQKKVVYNYQQINNRHLLQTKKLYQGINSQLVDEIEFSYNNNGNIIQQIKNNQEKQVILWGYHGEYPVAIITGTDYNTVLGILTEPQINGILNASDDLLESNLMDYRLWFSNQKIPVTTYLYEPLVGVKTVITPLGEKTTYFYDVEGRLESVKNHNNQVVDSYKYYNSL